MTTRGDLLESAARALAGVTPLPTAVLTDAELFDQLRAVERVGRLADSLRVSLAGELDHRARPSLGTEGLAYRNGLRTLHLLEQVTGAAQNEAARRLRVARELKPGEALDGTPLPAPFPAVTAAFQAGEIGIDSALAIAKNLRPALDTAPHDVVADAEEQLVLEAQRISADLVAGQAITWRSALDPDGAEPRLEKIREKRRFSIGRENAEGLVPFGGLAEPFFAATLRSAMGDRTSPTRSPKFMHPHDATCEDPTAEHPFPADGRTREQRNYDVLEGLLTAGIRADRDNTGPLHSTASVSVVVRASDVAAESGPAWLDDIREPITAALAAVASCDAGIQLIGVDDNGQPLWLGRRERYFTAAQRKAMAVRDGGCVFPGCDAPPSWCHAHHVVYWARGGPTDIDNGVLLCAFHHRLIHRGEFRLRMNKGRPELLSPRWVDRDQQWRPVGGARWQRAA